MGFTHPRAICPNCGGKIHTHREGIRDKTGTVCPLCGEKLTGNVKAGRRAERAYPSRRT